MNVLERITEAGLIVEVDGDRLIVRPKERITDEVRSIIRDNKPEILAALRKPLPERVSWESPLFGRLEAGPVLEQGPDTFILRHPLTQEIVELPNEWLASLDERSAIMEYDAGLPREESDKQAKIEFFQLFRKGGGKP